MNIEMLLKFSINNYKIFTNDVTLDMRADRKIQHAFGNLIDARNKNFRELRFGAIIGSNNSGKSTIINALKCLRGIVAESSNSSPHKLEWYMLPDNNDGARDTTFDITFSFGEFIYHYKLTFARDTLTHTVKYEYLSSIKKTSAQEVTLFERDGDNIKFGTNISKYNDVTRYFSTENNSTVWNRTTTTLGRFAGLFNLDSFTEKYPNIQHILNAYYFIVDNIIFADDIDVTHIERTKIDENMISFIKSCGFDDISEIKYNGFGEIDVIHISGMKLSINEEPSVIKQLMKIYYFMNIENKLVIYDNFDVNMHPLLSHHLMEYMTANAKSQIVVVSYHMFAIEPTYLRHDQITITNVIGDKHEVYRVSDYDFRVDCVIKNKYFNGKIGGTPMFFNN